MCQNNLSNTFVILQEHNPETSIISAQKCLSHKIFYKFSLRRFELWKYKCLLVFILLLQLTTCIQGVCIWENGKFTCEFHQGDTSGVGPLSSSNGYGNVNQQMQRTLSQLPQTQTSNFNSNSNFNKRYLAMVHGIDEDEDLINPQQQQNPVSIKIDSIRPMGNTEVSHIAIPNSNNQNEPAEESKSRRLDTEIEEIHSILPDLLDPTRIKKILNPSSRQARLHNGGNEIPVAGLSTPATISVHYQFDKLDSDPANTNAKPNIQNSKIFSSPLLLKTSDTNNVQKKKPFRIQILDGKAEHQKPLPEAWHKNKKSTLLHPVLKDIKPSPFVSNIKSTSGFLSPMLNNANDGHSISNAPQMISAVEPTTLINHDNNNGFVALQTQTHQGIQEPGYTIINNGIPASQGGSLTVTQFTPMPPFPTTESENSQPPKAYTSGPFTIPDQYSQPSTSHNSYASHPAAPRIIADQQYSGSINSAQYQQQQYIHPQPTILLPSNNLNFPYPHRNNYPVPAQYTQQQQYLQQNHNANYPTNNYASSVHTGQQHKQQYKNKHDEKESILAALKTLSQTKPGLIKDVVSSSQGASLANGVVEFVSTLNKNNNNNNINENFPPQTLIPPSPTASDAATGTSSTRIQAYKDQSKYVVNNNKKKNNKNHNDKSDNDNQQQLPDSIPIDQVLSLLLSNQKYSSSGKNYFKNSFTQDHESGTLNHPNELAKVLYDMGILQRIASGSLTPEQMELVNKLIDLNHQEEDLDDQIVVLKNRKAKKPPIKYIVPRATSKSKINTGSRRRNYYDRDDEPSYYEEESQHHEQYSYYNDNDNRQQYNNRYDERDGRRRRLPPPSPKSQYYNYNYEREYHYPQDNYPQYQHDREMLMSSGPSSSPAATPQYTPGPLHQHVSSILPPTEQAPVQLNIVIPPIDATPSTTSYNYDNNLQQFVQSSPSPSSPSSPALQQPYSTDFVPFPSDTFSDSQNEPGGSQQGQEAQQQYNDNYQTYNNNNNNYNNNLPPRSGPPPNSGLSNVFNNHPLIHKLKAEWWRGVGAILSDFHLSHNTSTSPYEFYNVREHQQGLHALYSSNDTGEIYNHLDSYQDGSSQAGVYGHKRRQDLHNSPVMVQLLSTIGLLSSFMVLAFVGIQMQKGALPKKIRFGPQRPGLHLPFIRQQQFNNKNDPKNPASNLDLLRDKVLNNKQQQQYNVHLHFKGKEFLSGEEDEQHQHQQPHELHYGGPPGFVHHSSEDEPRGGIGSGSDEDGESHNDYIRRKKKKNYLSLGPGVPTTKIPFDDSFVSYLGNANKFKLVNNPALLKRINSYTPPGVEVPAPTNPAEPNHDPIRPAAGTGVHLREGTSSSHSTSIPTRSPIYSTTTSPTYSTTTSTTTISPTQSTTTTNPSQIRVQVITIPYEIPTTSSTTNVPSTTIVANSDNNNSSSNSINSSNSTLISTIE